MKRALLLTDPPGILNLSFGCVEHVLRDIYDGLLDIETLYDFSTVTLSRLSAYSIIILKTERWDNNSDRSVMGSLIAYVANGGCLLALGETLQSTKYHELHCLLGAQPIGQSGPCLLDFEKVSQHPISEQVDDFSLTESARFFELDPILKPDILFEMKYALGRYPAIWCHKYAWGKVLYAIPGLVPESFLPPVRKLLWKAGLWFLDRL